MITELRTNVRGRGNGVNVEKKPPLGIMPKHIWLEKRALDVTRAIEEYLTFQNGYQTILAQGWTEELVCLLKAINRAHEEYDEKHNIKRPESDA